MLVQSLRRRALQRAARGVSSSPSLPVFSPPSAFVGEPAPLFSTTGVNPLGEHVPFDLASRKGTWTGLLFYPKGAQCLQLAAAFVHSVAQCSGRSELVLTPALPDSSVHELIAYGDRAEEFAALNAEVFGVSIDSVDVLEAWLRTPRKQGGLRGLNMTLLSDIHKTIAQSYGCLMASRGFSARGLFLIDPAGVLQQVTINAPAVGRSVDETLRLIKAFQFAAEHGEVCPANWTPGAKTMAPSHSGSRSFFEEQAETGFSEDIPSIHSADELEAAIAAPGPLVLDFYASWCGKCRKLAPYIDELRAAHPNVRVVKIDADAHPALAARFKAEALPTIIAMRSGVETARVLGYKPALLKEAFMTAAQ